MTEDYNTLRFAQALSDFKREGKSDLMSYQEARNHMFSNTELQGMPVMTADEGKLQEAKYNDKSKYDGLRYLISDNCLIRQFSFGIWNNYGEPNEFVKEKEGRYYWK
jgi:hypothetical protein